MHRSPIFMHSAWSTPISADATELLNSLLDNGRWQCQAFGAGKFSQTFLAEAETGEQFVLRIAPSGSVLQLFYKYRMMRQEPGIHKRILAEASVPIPPIIVHDFSGRLIDRDFLIMPRIEGQPHSDMTLSPTAMDRFFRERDRLVAENHQIVDPDNRFGYLG